MKDKKILVVEDDEHLNKLISYNLIVRGFNPDSAFDGVEAKEKISREVFDVVILDIMLPGVDGFTICRAIKENPVISKTCVIILTARAQPLDKIYSEVIGADYYFTKPFNMSELMEIIKNKSLYDKNKNKDIYAYY
jgi:two-component system alkaline phosphatase synthesis response regulator PhoP